MRLSCKIIKFVLSILLSCTYCHAANTLTQGQSIKDGQTLTSPTNEFALGFFSPKNSSNRYVGIWYNKISEQTVVWVANRNNPITNSSGVLAFGNDGNLEVLDGSGKSLWSSNISSVNGGRSVTAILMDSGNLVLSLDDTVIDPDAERVLWQSFDDPTDTYLPGKRVWLTPRSQNDIFVSWKSESDPSPGSFSMGVNPQGLMEIMVWEGLKRRWRSGLWNGQVFIGVPNMPTSNYLFGYRVADIGGRTFFTYVVHNSSEIMRFRIKWDGTEEQLRWNEEKREWTRFFAWPVKPCELYNTCGQFGSCSASGTPICSCIRGFEPKSKTEWDSGNWTGGCVRRMQLLCDRNVSSGGEVKQDRFLELDSLNLPDFSVYRPSNGKDDCRDICLNNCSCKAYSYVDGIQCLTWSGDFFDVQKFQVGGQKLYVRLAASELPTRKSKVMLVIILVVVIGIVLLGIAAFIFWRYRAKLRGIFRKGKSETMRMDESREFWSGQADGEHNKGNQSELILHSFQEIVDGTNNFSSAYKLGEGGFGPVYKGNLACGKTVAVKRLSRMSGQGMEEFKNELILIAKLQHRNLVRLVGYCVEGEEKMLVYEYMPNKSLDAFVFGKPQEHLDWSKRFNIIEGIARGLLYLHRDSRLRIIHRDLKVSNILLDEEMTPKISDFGMAKIFGGNEHEANTVRVVGTYGYMAPEYAMEGLFSVKSDVYSFGVLLLEIISGKKNQFFHPEYSTKLIGYAWKLWGEDRAMEFIDPSIRDSCSQADALRCINVGLLCVQDSPMDRPIMSTVVLMLESDTAILPAPRQPTFTVGSNRMEIELSLDSSNAHSINNVTGSMVVGR
ncbi:non-specific serine/threonine protein kinase [Ranunculus cassubicifolius]